MDWPSVPLESVATDLQAGFACQPTDDIGGIPQLRTNNVSLDGRIDLSGVKRVPANSAQIAKYSLRSGDVLFNNTNSPALVGKTAFFDEVGLFLFSNHMTRIRIASEVMEPRYVARYLHWSWSQGTFRTLITQWVNQAAINRNRLSSVRVPLPSLAEQHRIVEILDRADDLRRLRAEADAKANRILPSLFIRMFGDPATNSMHWPIKRIGEVCDIVSGATPKTERPELWGGGIPWATPKDLSELDGWSLDRTARTLTGEGLASCSAAMVPEGSVLLSSRAPIGLVAVAGMPMCTNQGFKNLVCGPDVDPWYLFAWCKIRTTYLQSLGRGATFKEISKRIVESIELPLPPMQRQRRFRSRLMNLTSIHRARIQSARRIPISSASCSAGHFPAASPLPGAKLIWTRFFRRWSGKPTESLTRRRFDERRSFACHRKVHCSTCCLERDGDRAGGVPPVKTVSAFQITNFKAFGAAQRMPLRPITLIYGANSAGKSSILHALALAHHAIETGDLNTRRTRIGGSRPGLAIEPPGPHRASRRCPETDGEADRSHPLPSPDETESVTERKRSY